MKSAKTHCHTTITTLAITSLSKEPLLYISRYTVGVAMQLSINGSRQEVFSVGLREATVEELSTDFSEEHMAQV